MGMNFQLDRTWVNTYKAIRQCQKADKDLSNGKADAAAEHFGKAKGYFETAVDHLVKAEEDAEIKAGKLLNEGNEQLGMAIQDYAEGHEERAEKHYEKALDKYDEALDLIA